MKSQRLRASLLFGWAACVSPSIHACSAQPPAQQAATTPALTRADSARAFGQLVASLSEAGGTFDTDNLISNESGYLHVMGLLDKFEVRGGAYVGVGPDQNFSYIARIRPRIAFIIDIRRDNLLQHLMFKALFTRARNRAEYLMLWLGLPVPANVGDMDGQSLEALVRNISAMKPTKASADAARAMVSEEVQRSGVPLSKDDLETIRRFHTAFIDEGLSLQFTSKGRVPRDYYPTLKQLLLAGDRDGQMANYLVKEADYQFLREMEKNDLVVPVVGNLAGPRALAAIGELVRKRGEQISAFYVSNVEDYLFRGGSFPAYARTVAALPRNAHSVIIRSYFGGYHPESVPGFYSTQLLQLMSAFADVVAPGNFRSYRELALQYVPFR